MGANRPGKRRTQRLKRAKRHQADLIRKALASQAKEAAAPAQAPAGQ
jgi:hypothetical protein